MNKRKNNKSGFTLVELLAVIVVLAIVMLIGVNAILPQMDKARKNAFAVEANGAVKSAQQYYVTSSITGATTITDGSTGCVTIGELISSGQSSLKGSGDGAYSGYVTIKRNGNVYEYKVTMDNGTFSVKDVDGNAGIDVTSVQAHDTSITNECPSGTTNLKK